MIMSIENKHNENLESIYKYMNLLEGNLETICKNAKTINELAFNIGKVTLPEIDYIKTAIQKSKSIVSK
jgi:hypothetical protein